MKFKVMVEVHRYSDLSDKAREIWFDVDGVEDGDAAVYKLRDAFEAERKAWAVQQGPSYRGDGLAVRTSRSGKIEYIGAVRLGHAKPAVPRAPRRAKSTSERPGEELTVELAALPNPDFGEGVERSIRRHQVRVKDFAAASHAVRIFIERNGLGGGNWAGGTIRRGREVVGRVSYNGRVWDAQGAELKL